VHNCLTCNEGYLKSYEYMGNCYKIEYPLNNSDTKIINNKENDSYSVVDSCLNQVNKFKIVSTGECVSKCPESTVYHTFTYQKINFEEQGILPLEKMYPLTIEKPPKFLFGNLCYVNCPITTNTDNDNNLCKCKYGWEQNETTKEISCYNNKEYCLSIEYYYHIDTKECVLGGCRDGYYQFNFECYKNNCPDNTIQNLVGINKCESNLNYCYIDENYKTHCNQNFYDDYNLRYKDTKIYFKSCDESLFFLE